ncbi:MAG TPA: SGNH/GDSL hydrolase family protein [Firmicutes bacterium]|jgi:acyl-CoA thioesterase-1|nr:SGNH/GDSL hydrolase family protein [Bacillota bacterium]
MYNLEPAKLPFKNGDRIVFQGDSITDVGRNRQDDSLPGGGYVAVIKGLLTALRPDLQIEIINRGCGGNRTPELIARWDEDCINLHPTWLSLMIGVNDVWRIRGSASGQVHIPLPHYISNMRQLLDRAVESGIPNLILMSPTFIDKNLNSDLNLMLIDYNEAVKQLAQEYNAIYINVRDKLKEAITQHPEVNWLPDGCHPGVAGHTIIGVTWLKALEGVR